MSPDERKAAKAMLDKVGQITPEAPDHVLCDLTGKESFELIRLARLGLEGADYCDSLRRRAEAERASNEHRTLVMAEAIRQRDKALAQLAAVTRERDEQKTANDTWRDACMDAREILGYVEGESTLDAAQRVTRERDEALEWIRDYEALMEKSMSFDHDATQWDQSNFEYADEWQAMWNRHPAFGAARKEQKP